MTYFVLISALLGYATTVIPHWFTYYVSTFLFAVFGLRMLREGWSMSPDEGQEELEEVQADLKRRDEEVGISEPKKGKFQIMLLCPQIDD